MVQRVRQVIQADKVLQGPTGETGKGGRQGSKGNTGLQVVKKGVNW